MFEKILQIIFNISIVIVICASQGWRSRGWQSQGWQSQELQSQGWRHSQPQYCQQYNTSQQQCNLFNFRQSGVCVKISQCQVAQHDYRYLNIPPTICYYKNREPVVCCPCISNNRYTNPLANIRQTTKSPNPSSNLWQTGNSNPSSNLWQTGNSNPSSNLRQTTRSTTTTTTTTRAPWTRPTVSETEGAEERISQRKCVYPPGIVGGEITEPDEFPFMAAVGWKNFNKSHDFNCGGFLIDRTYVITAAHCATFGGSTPDVVQIGGETLKIPSAEVIEIERVIIHPQYNRKKTYNDIAILKLKRESINVAACLYQFNILEKAKVNVIAIGYGHTMFGGPRSKQLRKTRLQLFKNRNCDQYYKPDQDFPNGIIDSQLCAGDISGARDTCQGDSGGPLINIVNTTCYIVGITSVGPGCATGIPSIYTRISSYLDWIESVVWADGLYTH